FTLNSAYGFALLLSMVLLGLVLGSLLQALWSRRYGDSWRRLAFCQWLLAGVTLATLPFFRTAPAWLDEICDGSSMQAVFWAETALTASALLVPAILMGLSLPLLVAAAAGEPQRFGNWLGRLYAVNTLGCVAGAFLSGFVLIPWLGIQNTFAVIVLAMLVVGCVAWGMASRPAASKRLVVGGTVLLAAGVLLACISVGGFHKGPIDEPGQLLFYQEGNTAPVSVIQEGDGSRSIFVDGQPVAGTSGPSIIDQKILAHLPLLLHPSPKRALTVGF